MLAGRTARRARWPASPGSARRALAAEFCRRAHTAGAAVLAGTLPRGHRRSVRAVRRGAAPYVAACPLAELPFNSSPSRRELLAARAGARRRAPVSAADRRRRPNRSASACSRRSRRCWPAASLARPLILLLDDLHWADDASLLLLRHIVRATERLAADGARHLPSDRARPARRPRGGDRRAATCARARMSSSLEGLCRRRWRR